MNTVLVASPTGDFEARVREVMGDRVNGNLRHWSWTQEQADVDGVAGALIRLSPAVVALGPGLPVDMSVAVASAIDQASPGITVLIVAEPTPELWRRAVRAGARDLVSPAADDAELREAMERALDAAERRRVQAAAPAPATRDHRTIMVISPKGGVGKTTISTNLAVGLAQRAPREVVIVDLDLQFGDVADALRLVPERTVIDACRAGSPLDATELKMFLAAHPSGLYALCAPGRPAEADEVTDTHVDRLVATLVDEFRYVILDTSAGLTEPTLAALRHVTDLVLVCSTDVLSVRGMHKVVETLDGAGVTGPRRHFVLNRTDARVGVTAEDVEGAVGMAVDVAIPSSRSVPLSTNQGQPLLEHGEGSPAVRPLLELVHRFHDAPTSSQSLAAGRWWRRKP